MSEDNRSKEELLAEIDALSERVHQLEAAEKQLRDTEVLHLQRLDAIQDLILCKGPGSKIMYANKAFREFYGMSMEELNGIIDAPFNQTEYTKQYVEDDAFVFNSGKSLDIAEEPVTRYDGKVQLFHTIKSPIFNASGQVEQTIGVSRDITERKLAELALAQRAQELGELNRKLIQSEAIKSEFLANVSHELRTPLTLMLGPLESMLNQQYGPINAEQDENLKRVQSNALRLLQLISGLLDFSRLESGHTKVDRKPLNLPDLARGIMADFQLLMSNRKLSSELIITGSTPWVELDRHLFERIFFNLLSNAVKFTPEGGDIYVQLHLENDRMRLNVRDTGKGIPADELTNIFQRFRQIEGSSTRRIEGVGLGLALVKEFTELLGGSVDVESVAGKGSIFYVECYAPACPPAEASTLPETPVIPLPQPVSASKPSFESRTNGLLPKVILAEDNAELAFYISGLLSEVCCCRVVMNGDDAVKLVNEWMPDLIISDVMLPGQDGFEVCSQVKSDPKTRAIPVVLLTALTHQEALLKGWEAGADDYLYKPFHPKELVTRVSSILDMVAEKKEAENRVKEFYSVISHELRTPLTSIRAALGLIEGGFVGELPIEARDLIRTARVESDRLIRLISAILDIRKIEANKLELKIAPFEAKVVLEEALASMQGYATEAHVRLSSNIESHLRGTSITADRDRILQVLSNLLSNAIKFSDEGDEVIAGLSAPASEFIRFTISDHGPGIPVNQEGKLFGIFQQLDSSDTRAKGGTGLGLAISKRIVELHGGRIGFERNSEGGSTFWFEIPMSHPTAKSA